MKRLCIRDWGFAIVLLGTFLGARCPNTPTTPDSGPNVDGGPTPTLDASDEGGIIASPEGGQSASEAGVEGGADLQDAAPDMDARHATPCVLACRNLKALGCDEGTKSSCASTCQNATTTKLTNLHPDCLSKAHSKAEARKCGSVTCP